MPLLVGEACWFQSSRRSVSSMLRTLASGMPRSWAARRTSSLRSALLKSSVQLVSSLLSRRVFQVFSRRCSGGRAESWTHSTMRSCSSSASDFGSPGGRGRRSGVSGAPGSAPALFVPALTLVLAFTPAGEAGVEDTAVSEAGAAGAGDELCAMTPAEGMPAWDSGSVSIVCLEPACGSGTASASESAAGAGTAFKPGSMFPSPAPCGSGTGSKMDFSPAGESAGSGGADA